MDRVHELMRNAVIEEAKSSAVAQILEGTLADMFRLYRAADDGDVKNGIGAVADKLLALHAVELGKKAASGRIMADLREALRCHAQGTSA